MSILATSCAIGAVYLTTLGRDPDPAGEAYWESHPDRVVVQGLLHSEELDTIDWAESYRLVLGREPDHAGLHYWSTLEDQEAAVVGFVNSSEAGCTLDLGVDIEEELDYAAHLYGLDPQGFRKVAWCESSYNPRATNGWHRGIFQFNPETWAWIESLGAPFPGADRFDPVANIHRAAWLMARPNLGGWGHWTCKR